MFCILHGFHGRVLFHLLVAFGRGYSSVISMFGDEPGFSPPRRPRGFRRRWSERSAASVSHVASPPGSVAPPSEANDCMGDYQSEMMEGFDNFNSWMYIPHDAAADDAD